MTTVLVSFSATPSKALKGYWLAVDELDVAMVNNQGQLRLDDTSAHFLTWHMAGDAGESLGISAKVSNQTVVEIKQSSIPPGQVRGGGVKRFSLS